MSEPIIRMRGVSVKYRLATERPATFQEYIIGMVKGKRSNYEDFWALKDIDVAIGRGENTGIIGPNGAGKSTLLKVVAGVLEPTEGELKVNGKVAPLIELGAGFDMDLTGEENIFLNASILGLTRRQIKSKFGSITAFSELENFIYSPLRTYSSGMVARLAFSIAVEMDAEILIVDEVLSVGDEGFRKKCHRKIDDFIRGGVTLLFVSHSMGEVERLCNRVVLLEHGRLLASGDPDIVSRRYILQFDKTAFEDIPEGLPYKKYIDELFIRGITNGYTVNGKRFYNPDNKVSRAEFAVFLSRALGMKKSYISKPVFVDVSENHWASQFISWIYEKGLAETFEDDKGHLFFYPDDYITLRDVRAVLKKINMAKCEKVVSDVDRVINRGEMARLLCEFFDWAGGDIIGSATKI